MRRGWMQILMATAALGGAGTFACAQADGFVGPPALPQTVSSAPGDDGGSTDIGRDVPVQEALPLGGTTADAAPVRRRYAGRDPEAAAGATPALRAGEGWWRTAAALAAVVALIAALGAGVRAWARRSGGVLHAIGPGGRAPAGLLQVLGRYPVGRGQSLVLLKLDRRVLLASQSGGARAGGMQTLCEITDPEEVASILVLAAEADGRSLASRFREMVSGFDASHEQAERALAPVAVEIAPPDGGTDPLGGIRSRLDTLRRLDRGASI